MTVPSDPFDRHRACVVALGADHTFREAWCPCATVALVQCDGCREALFVKVASPERLAGCGHVGELVGGCVTAADGACWLLFLTPPDPDQPPLTTATDPERST